MSESIDLGIDLGTTNSAIATMKNGRPATSGACSFCGTKVFRIGSPSSIGEPEEFSPAIRNTFWSLFGGLYFLVVCGVVVTGVILALRWLFTQGPAWDEKMPWLVAGIPGLIGLSLVVGFIVAALYRVFPSMTAKWDDNAVLYVMGGIVFVLIPILVVIIWIGEAFN